MPKKQSFKWTYDLDAMTVSCKELATGRSFVIDAALVEENGLQPRSYLYGIGKRTQDGSSQTPLSEKFNEYKQRAEALERGEWSLPRSERKEVLAEPHIQVICNLTGLTKTKALSNWKAWASDKQKAFLDKYADEIDAIEDARSQDIELDDLI